MALNGIVGELGICDAIEAVAALGVLLNVPGHEIRGVTGNLDELGVDQARARAAFVAGAVGDGETRSDGDGLGYYRVETAEQPIATHGFIDRGLEVRFGAGAQCRLDAPAHVVADVAGREYAAQGQRLCRSEPHGVQAACVTREGYRSILIVEGYVRSAVFIGNALQ